MGGCLSVRLLEPHGIRQLEWEYWSKGSASYGDWEINDWEFLQQKSPSGGGGHEGLSVVCHSSSVHWVQCRLLAVAQYVLEG